MSRRWKILLAGYFLWLLLPLFLASLARPFGWWDYFTAQDLLHSGSPPARLAANYWTALLKGTFVVRPTVALLYDLQYLLFGGEFWLWYALKWAAKVGAVWLVWRLSRRLGAGEVAALAAAVFVLFHPAAFQLMLLAPDGWVALGAMAALCLLPGEQPFEVSRFGTGRYWALFAVWYLTLGAKEVAVAFGGLLVLALTLGSQPWRDRAATWRLAPFWAMLGFWTWRLAGASGRVDSVTPGLWWRNFLEHLWLLWPHSPWYVFDVLIPALAVWGIWANWRTNTVARRWLPLLGLGSALAMLLLTSRIQTPAPRYVVPASFLLAVPFALGLQALPRLRQATAWAVVLVYPLATTSDLYAQELSYQQQFYEKSQLLAVMERHAERGAKLVVSGEDADVALERQRAVAEFFERDGPPLYDIPARDVMQAKAEGWPEGRFVLLSGFDPAAVSAGRLKGLEVSRLEAIQQVGRGRYGLLGRLTSFYQSLDRATGNQREPRWDLGTLPAVETPLYWLYEFRSRSDKPPPARIEEIYPARDLRRERWLDGPERFAVRKGEVWEGTVTIGTPAPHTRVIWDGVLFVESGQVRLVIADDLGRELWTAEVGPPGSLLQPPALPFEPARRYRLLLRLRTESAFTLRDFRLLARWEVERIPPSRRYGALGL